VSLPVRTTPEADAQIREIDEWWRSNRPAAPDLFLHELTASFDIIGHTPHIGRLYRGSSVPGARRLLLKSTRYHVYYVPRSEDVRVLAVWHARRGVGPPLRAS
jgi:plasmid stabilization system protein ParE